MLKVGQKIEGKVESIAFGGNGIIRYENFVIFVPFTAKNDVARVQINSVKKNYAFGKLDLLIQPSPDRVIAKCPYFGWCGGCQLQHIHYEAQLRAKKQFLEDAFQRIAHMELPSPIEIIPSKPHWHYRRYITLQLRPTLQGYECGYVAIDNSTLVGIDQCPIFLEGEHPIFLLLKTLASELESIPNNDGRLILMKDDSKFILDLRFNERIPSNTEKILIKYFDNNILKGISISSPKDKFERGDLTVSFSIQNLNIKCSSSAFVQSNTELSKSLYEKAFELIVSSASPRLLDLYCGIGITSLLAKKAGMQVVSVESSEKAIELAKTNASTNGLEGIEWHVGLVEKKIDALLSKYKPQTVLINPPRTGIHEEVVDALLKDTPQCLVYISCMPATLARDVQRLGEKFRPSKAFVFDMFPQTSHLETLLCLEKI